MKNSSVAIIKSKCVDPEKKFLEDFLHEVITSTLLGFELRTTYDSDPAHDVELFTYSSFCVVSLILLFEVNKNLRIFNESFTSNTIALHVYVYGNVYVCVCEKS